MTTPGSPPAEAYPHRPEADSFELAGAFATIKRAAFGHKWMVALTMVLTTSLVGLYVYIWPPTFEADVLIAFDSEKDIQRTAFYQGWNIFRREGLTDEATLIVGMPVLRATAEKLNLRYEDVYHPFTRYVIYLWGRSWVGRHYRDLKNWLLGSDPNPFKLSDEQIERYRLLSDMQAGITTRQVGEASIGVLEVRGSNQKVATIANTIVEIYLKQRRDRYVQEAQQARDSLKEEADKVENQLRDLDSRIRDFRARTGAVLVFEKDRSQIGQSLVLRAAVTDLQSQIAANRAELESIGRQLAAEGERLAPERVFRDDALKDRLAKLEVALGAARQAYQSSSPEVRDLEVQIAAGRAELARPGRSEVIRDTAHVGASYEALRARQLQLESDVAGEVSALAIKTAELERMHALMDQIPEKMQISHELERDQSYLETELTGLNDKLAVATVSMASAKSAPPAMRVVEPASVPEQPIWPQTKLLMASAVLAGIVVGVIAALMLELIFVRADPARLASGRDGLSLFAVVERDDDFLDAIFPRRPASRS